LATDENGNVIGKFLGANCYVKEKVKSIQVLFNEIGSPLRTYAYGDSCGDIPMLDFVDDGYQVRKLFGFYRNIIHWCSANHRRSC
jgi:phosphoserine phosphatase